MHLQAYSSRPSTSTSIFSPALFHHVLQGVEAQRERFSCASSAWRCIHAFLKCLHAFRNRAVRTSSLPDRAHELAPGPCARSRTRAVRTLSGRTHALASGPCARARIRAVRTRSHPGRRPCAHPAPGPCARAQASTRAMRSRPHQGRAHALAPGCAARARSWAVRTQTKRSCGNRGPRS